MSSLTAIEAAAAACLLMSRLDLQKRFPNLKLIIHSELKISIEKFWIIFMPGDS